MNKAKSDNWSPNVCIEPLIAIVISSTVAHPDLPLPRVSFWQLSRMKYKPVVQTWVRWIPACVPHAIVFSWDDSVDAYINTLPLTLTLLVDDDDEDAFNGGLELRFAHDLACLLARIKPAVPEVKMYTLLSTACGPMLRRVDGFIDEDPLETHMQ